MKNKLFWMSKSSSHMIKRVTNCLRLCVNYLLSSLLKRPIVTHAPFFLSIEPVNVCNLRCPQCPTGMGIHPRSKRYFDLDLFGRLLQEVGDRLLCVQFYFQGEPLLCPSLCAMIAQAKEAGIYTIVSTNAQLLTQTMAYDLVISGLDKLIVSMDGLSQESYSAYRVGGDVEKVKQALHHVSQCKKKLCSSSPCVELQWLVLSSNEQEMPLIRKQYKQLGADKLVFKTAQFYSIPQGDPLMPRSSAYNRYRRLVDGTWQLKSRLRCRCWRLWSGAVIDTEGNVRSCCFDKEGKYILGNLHQDSFMHIWHGELAQQFRERLLHHRPHIDICRNCTE